MKRFPTALFSFIFCIAFFSHAHDLPHLCLHFDVNKTIIATDAVQGKDLEATVNGVLAEFTYACWDGNREQSYYAYITDQIALEHPELTRASEEFKIMRSQRLHEFPIFLVQYPDLLTQYEYDKKRMLELLSKDETVIFPSFYNAIQWLDEHFPKHFAIYLRTFGQDLPEVVPVIEEHCSLQFASFGEFQNNKLSVAAPEQSVYDFFMQVDPIHYALHDDYEYWKANGFQARGGKPFPIDIQQNDIISIFFDDNATDSDKPIINPIGPDGGCEETALLLKRGNIVAVNTKEAILDPNYFINKIKVLMPNFFEQQ